MTQPNTTSKRVCKFCGSDRLPPGRLKYQSYRCNRCHNQRNIAARARWQAKTGNSRVLKIYGTYYGYAKDAEQARQIKAHARKRLNGFIAGFAAGAETESDSDGAVAVETAPGDD